MVTIATLLLIICGGNYGLADQSRRFPQPRISAQEWQTYFDEVKAKSGAQDISRADRPDVVAIAVPSEQAVYYFTKPGGAHPAVVIAQVIQRGTAILIEHSGYFAGSEEAFAKWFGAFANQSEFVRTYLKSPH